MRCPSLPQFGQMKCPSLFISRSEKRSGQSVSSEHASTVEPVESITKSAPFTWNGGTANHSLQTTALPLAVRESLASADAAGWSELVCILSAVSEVSR